MTEKTKEQLIPLLLTVVTFLFLIFITHTFIGFLNLLPSTEKILLKINPIDIMVGLLIYLKTAIDFAIFIGNLMHSNPGWKNRISIELGTAFGNAMGTLIILLIWNFFREVPLLMASMIILASFVLLKMAEESLSEFLEKKEHSSSFLINQLRLMHRFLRIPNSLFSPILGLIIPKTGLMKTGKLPLKKLFFFSMTVPFILGLDDFAGYIPLFSIINVYGFAIGVFLGHMILNIALFISPTNTVKAVRYPPVLLLGGLAFIGIALWGLYEAAHILIKFF